MVFTASVDGLPLKDSKRLVLMHATDVLNTDMTFTDKARQKLEKWGDLPHLVRAGKTSIRLALASPSGWKVWAVDLSGRQLYEVALQPVKDGALLNADTHDSRGTVLAYELRKL